MYLTLRYLEYLVHTDRCTGTYGKAPEYYPEYVVSCLVICWRTRLKVLIVRLRLKDLLFSDTGYLAYVVYLTDYDDQYERWRAHKKTNWNSTQIIPRRLFDCTCRLIWCLRCSTIRYRTIVPYCATQAKELEYLHIYFDKPFNNSKTIIQVYLPLPRYCQVHHCPAPFDSSSYVAWDWPFFLASTLVAPPKPQQHDFASPQPEWR